MRYVDAHCDVLSKLLLDPKLDFAGGGDGLDVTLTRLQRAGALLQCFAIWIPDRLQDSGADPVEASIRLFQERIAGEGGLAFVRTSADLEAAANRGEIAALLTLEGVDALGGRPERVRTLFRQGVRCLGLTWNYANWAADGVLEPRGGGLTLKGRELVKECDRLGMIVDVSHLAERSFWELAERSERPLIASHANVFERCGHPRNLNRKQIELIASGGGVIGINFYPPFLREGEAAAIDDVVRHIETVWEWGGERAVGLGSDFDGIPTKVPGLESPLDLPRLAEALAKRYSDEQLENIWWRNWYDFFVKALPKSEC